MHLIIKNPIFQAIHGDIALMAVENSVVVPKKHSVVALTSALEQLDIM